MIKKYNNLGKDISIEEAEVGDELMVNYGNCLYTNNGTPYSKVTVTKVTRTQITTSDGNRWTKSGCRRVGRINYDRMYLMAYDESVIAKSIAEAARKSLAQSIKNGLQARLSGMSAEKLEEIRAILDRAE